VKKGPLRGPGERGTISSRATCWSSPPTTMVLSETPGLEQDAHAGVAPSPSASAYSAFAATLASAGYPTRSSPGSRAAASSRIRTHRSSKTIPRDRRHRHERGGRSSPESVGLEEVGLALAVEHESTRPHPLQPKILKARSASSWTMRSASGGKPQEYVAGILGAVLRGVVVELARRFELDQRKAVSPSTRPSARRRRRTSRRSRRGRSWRQARRLPGDRGRSLLWSFRSRSLRWRA